LDETPALYCWTVNSSEDGFRTKASEHERHCP
jgi:hypothetical protein